jgi:DUF1680 family protein
VEVNGVKQDGVQAAAFVKIEREWKNGDRVAVHFPMAVRVSHWYHNSIAVERGPLVYSLKIGESWRKEKQTGPVVDWEVFPTTPWNYGLMPDSFRAVEITARGRRVPEWQLVNDSAGPIPESPLPQSKQPEETLTLIPYGAAKLRITAFPYFLQKGHGR